MGRVAPVKYVDNASMGRVWKVRQRNCLLRPSNGGVPKQDHADDAKRSLLEMICMIRKLSSETFTADFTNSNGRKNNFYRERPAVLQWDIIERCVILRFSRRDAMFRLLFHRCLLIKNNNFLTLDFCACSATGTISELTWGKAQFYGMRFAILLITHLRFFKH